MVCGGFACSKNCLCALNLLYTLVSLLLIGIAAWGIGFGLISSLRVVGVVIAVGIFLFLIALVGLIGAVKHHQVLLFFYMIILLLVFIVQFSVSCACLALNQEQQAQLLEVGWNNTASARDDIQRNLNCCGFRSFNPNDTCLASCVKSSHPCSPCAPIIGRYAGEVLRFVGGIGLFFSFTETPWTVACQAPLTMEFPRQEYWIELPFPSSGDLPNPGIEPTSPALTGGFFTIEPPGEALVKH
uniref:Tetraspanin 13 n=1 Tax=Bos taurus TaxID=9913 RepID=A0AAA9TX27_BOVIN